MHGADPGRQATRWLTAQARSVRRSLAGAITCGAINGALLIAQALTLAHLIARTIFGRAPLAAEWPWLAGLLGIYALRAVAVWGRDRASQQAGNRIRRRTRADLVGHIHALGPVWVDGREPGALANTVVDGVDALYAYFADYLPQASLAVVVPLMILAVAFPVDWISGLVFLGTVILIPVFMVVLGRSAAAMNERQWRRMARLSSHFYEVLAGLPVLASFGAARAEAAVVGKLSEDYRSATMRVLRVAFLSSFALEFLSMLSIAMVAVFIGFRLLWGDVGFSAGLAVLLLAPEFYLPLRKLGDSWHTRLAAVAAAEDIAEIMALPVRTHAGRARIAAGAAMDVHIERVTYTYPGSTRASLDAVSLALTAGTHVAIIGRTGAGKSTLTRLLLGFITPDAGSVRIGPQSLADLDPAEWRRHVAWVPQRAHVFPATVAENIALGVPGARRAAIIAAAEAAQARGFIEALPRGFDTPIGEGEAALSGGEIQRIALARAFLRDAPLLILDEPTASLDAESEAAVMRALARLARGRTVLSIAHRLYTLRAADRIVLLADGRIVTGDDARLRDALGRPPQGASATAPAAAAVPA